MKISVLIIAHNEEAYIRECVESILRQSTKPDEIILLVHNSTDSTESIARNYSITIVPFDGPAGIPYARIEGLAHVTGDIVCCIDADSRAETNWIEALISELKNGAVLVGSLVYFEGTFLSRVFNMFNRFFAATKGESVALWIWGPSFAFWMKDKEKVQSIYAESIELSKTLALTRNPEDYWLALFMSREGALSVTKKTSVFNHVKEKFSLDSLKRMLENRTNAKKISDYFKSPI